MLRAAEYVPVEIDATIAGNIVLHDLPPPPLERLMLRLRVRNEKYVRAVRMGFHSTEPEWIEAMTEMPDGSTHVPRGAVTIVKEQLARCGHSLRVKTDARSEGTPHDFRIISGAEMRNYQSEGIEKILRQLQGLIILPCGCGKTLLGVGAIARVKRSTIIVVHTMDLADQWEEEVRTHLGLRAGVIGGGRCETNEAITIGVDDSLVPFLEANPWWGQRFGFCIIDEAHHTPSKTFLRALALLPARWRLGLTATPTREDGQTEIMDWSFGPRLLERNTAEMIKLDYLMAAEIEEVLTGWRFEWDGDANDPSKIAEMEAALAMDIERNAGIADRATAEARAGETVLLLANRKEMVRELKDMILGRGMSCEGVTSSMSKKKRRASIAAFKEGGLPILIATSLADEGLNVPRLSRVILAFPQKAEGATTQRLGRLLRPYKKKPKLIDYVDADVPTLARRASDRRRVYRKANLIP